jgi:hypothetical protein
MESILLILILILYIVLCEEESRQKVNHLDRVIIEARGGILLILTN